MTDLTDAAAAELKYDDLNSAASPWPQYRELREQGGVVRSGDLGGFWGLLGYEQVKAAAADPARFSSAQGATIPRMTDPRFPAVPLEADPPEAGLYRKLLQGPLRPGKMSSYVGLITDLTRSWLREHAGTGRADLKELAATIPPEVIAHILGLDAKDADDFVEWSHGMVEGAATNNPELRNSSVQSLLGYIIGKINHYREEPDDTLFSAVANGEVKGEQISVGAAAGAIFVLIVAGHETTINGIASLLQRIGSSPELKQTLVEQPDRIPDAVEEILRFEAPIQFMGRTLTEDTEINDRSLQQGDSVALMFGAANHDPAKFPDPEKFDIDRDHSGHLAFGHGVHRCVGEHLARLEMKIVTEEVLKWMPDYVVDGPVELRRNAASNRGPVSLQVTFTPPAGDAPQA